MTSLLLPSAAFTIIVTVTATATSTVDLTRDTISSKNLVARLTQPALSAVASTGHTAVTTMTSTATTTTTTTTTTNTPLVTWPATFTIDTALAGAIAPADVKVCRGAAASSRARPHLRRGHARSDAKPPSSLVLGMWRLGIGV